MTPRGSSADGAPGRPPLGPATILLLVEALILLSLARAIVRWTPFKAAGWLASWPCRGPAPADPEALRRRVRWAIDAGARRSAWRAMCFERGLAAQVMLRRRGVDSTLYFGAGPDAARGLVAHVWVRDGDRDIIGCEDLERYGVLAVFPVR